ncbi:hypothetical protein LTR84_010527 [Exophiala bonariae]|uniref:Zn(2)-C6 fungal-type domain-containing protein n=1 Tax=Exophiala bonariae TaxID=1690606 RepID=A0AAV9MT36_9EURO|nr:hypothetical protein LTR84_010527 [Exophiala bonariae]
MEDREQRKRKRLRTDREPALSLNKSSIKRISRACDSCRQKKNRCDGVRPACSQCAAGGIKCMYGAQTRKRGLPTGYVRILEALWAITLRLVPKSEETALKLLKGVSVRYDEEEKVIFESGHLIGDEPLRKIWAQSRLRQRIDQMVGQFENGADPNISRQQPMDLLKSSMSSLDDGTTIAIEPWYTNKEPYIEKEDRALELGDMEADITIDDTIGQQQEEVQESLRWQELSSVPTGSRDSPLHSSHSRRTRKFQVPHAMWALIDIYFNSVHCWFPIVQKHTIMKIASSSQDGLLEDDYEIGLLSAILATSSSYDSSINNNLIATDSQFHYESALQMISIEGNHAHALSIAQILLLLSVVDMGRGNWTSASILVGRATRTVLLRNEKQSEISAANISSGSLALIKRVTLGSFILDTLISAHLQTLPHLRSQDVQNLFDFEEDGPDEWDQWINNAQSIHIDTRFQPSSRQQIPLRALSTFKNYGSLCCILNDAICKSFIGHNFDQADGPGFTSILDSWVANLPKHIQLTPENVTIQFSPPTANLYLNYSVVLLYLQLSPHSARKNPTRTGIRQASGVCAASLKAYKDAFGLYEWKALHELYTGLQTRLGAFEPPYTIRYHAGQGRSSDVSAKHGATSVLPVSYDTRQSNVEPLAEGINSSFAGQQDIELSSHLARSQFEIFPRFQHSELMQGEANPLSNPQPHEEVLAGHDMPLPSENFDSMSVDMTISLSPFNRFQDAGTVESLLEELSSINENDWDMMPSQFMYNLGFYDTETKG